MIVTHSLSCFTSLDGYWFQHIHLPHFESIIVLNAKNIENDTEDIVKLRHSFARMVHNEHFLEAIRGSDIHRQLNSTRLQSKSPDKHSRRSMRGSLRGPKRGSVLGSLRSSIRKRASTVDIYVPQQEMVCILFAFLNPIYLCLYYYRILKIYELHSTIDCSR